MAEQLDDYAFVERGRPTKYPDVWFNGKPWRLVKGKDFEQDVRKFRNVLYTCASNRGLKIKTTLEDDRTVVMCTYEAPPKKRAVKKAK